MSLSLSHFRCLSPLPRNPVPRFQQFVLSCSHLRREFSSWEWVELGCLKNITVKLARLQCFQPIKLPQLGGTPLRVWSIPYGGGEAWQATDSMNGPEENVWRKLLKGHVWKLVLCIVCRTVGVGFDASRKEWTQATLTTTTTTSLARLGWPPTYPYNHHPSFHCAYEAIFSFGWKKARVLFIEW